MKPLLCILSASVLLSLSASAQAAGTPQQRRACREDAMRYCREFVPRVSAITRCMEKNIGRLSPACRAQFK
ncbi:hypothetical protein E0H22_17170 [Rhodopseudomonas boonkerdii]|nr:hypothetical protein E0H22_17170 [Rhodopseudomonas boonkerdii]